MTVGASSGRSGGVIFRRKTEVGRAVTSGGDAKDCDSGTIPVTAFTRHGTNEISVDRFGHATVGVYISNGEAVARERGAGRRFHGWLVITHRALASLGLRAALKPEAGNRQHANILLPAEAAGDNTIHDRWAFRLARRSQWVKRGEVE